MTQLFSSHLLDGMLGRSCALFAVAMLSGIFVWQHYLKVSIPARKSVMLGVLLTGFAGVALSLNSTFFQLAEPVGEETSAVPWQDILPLLLQTSYGRYWIGFGLLLMLAWRTVLHARWLLLTISGLIACLAMTSHAADQGFTATLVFHMVHLSCVLLWWGGLMLMVLGRYAKLCTIEQPALLAFSRLILPIFLLGLATGGLRLAGVFFENKALNTAYWMLVAVKVGLACAVSLCAWQLRQLLQRVPLDEQGYDDKLGMEFFLAVLLLLAAAMLTQLPPL